MGRITLHATGERLGDACRTCRGTGQLIDRYEPDQTHVVPCPDCGMGGLCQRALWDAQDAARLGDLLFGPRGGAA